MKSYKIILLSLIVASLSFSGCSKKEPASFANYKGFYNIQCGENKNFFQDEIVDEIINNSRYGKLNGSLGYGLSGSLDEKNKRLVLYYTNSISGLDGFKQNIIKVEIPYSLEVSTYKTTIRFAKTSNVVVVKDDADQFDSFKNIKNDVENLLNSTRYQQLSTNTIDFDPKQVKIGKAASVTNGLLHSNIVPIDGYESTICSYDDGCDKNTYYQHIEVELKDGERVSVIQSITDERYDFIHNGDNVYLFKLEDNTWIVKKNRQNNI